MKALGDFEALELAAEKTADKLRKKREGRGRKWDGLLDDVDEQIARVGDATRYDPAALEQIVGLLKDIADGYEEGRMSA